MKPSDDIASEIVGRYAWNGNVMYKGRLVGQQVLVAQDICEAIERERAENARLRAALDIARTGLLKIERRCEEARAELTRAHEQTGDGK